MSQTTEDASFAAIADDNTWAHQFPDVSMLVKQRDIGVTARGGMEFFDLGGRRLAPVFSPAWELVDLRPTNDQPDPEGVRQRLAAVVAHVEAYVGAHPELAKRFGLTHEQAIAALPQLRGTTVRDFLASFPGPEHSNRGNFFHNALHAAGWTH